MPIELVVILAIVIPLVICYLFWFEPAMTRKDGEIAMWRDRALSGSEDPHDVIGNVKIIDGSEPDDGEELIDFQNFYDKGEDIYEV